jgi:hypothetical protein
VGFRQCFVVALNCAKMGAAHHALHSSGGLS